MFYEHRYGGRTLELNPDAISWTHEISVGHPLIDMQHQQLISLFHQAVRVFSQSDRWTESCFEVLNDIAEGAMRHFDVEERLLSKNGYPHLAEHRQRHCEYLNEINEAVFKAMREQIDKNQLLVILSDWLLHHITDADLMAQEYFG